MNDMIYVYGFAKYSIFLDVGHGLSLERGGKSFS